MIGPRASSALLAAATAGVSLTVVCAIAASGRPPEPSSSQVAAFRPPAELARAASDDPVWRLGARLFYDARLSASGRTSCATCHEPDRSWTDARPRAVGDAGKTLAFRTPTLLDTGMLDRHGWTGRFPDMASVTFFAISSPTNMNQPIGDAVRTIDASGAYRDAWTSAFGHPDAGAAELGRALTTYVGSITSAPAPFDRWMAGDATAVPYAAKRGFALFTGKARCAACHGGWAFTDGSFHDIGTSANEPGRGALFKTSVKLQHAFKTPTLRNVAARAPYMHDGSKATLRDVVDLYDRGGIARPSRADDIAPLGLSPTEKDDLLAFLDTLSSESRFALHAR